MNQTKSEKILTDEILADVIKHKKAIAKEFDYDVRALVRSLQKQEQNHPNLIYPSSTESTQNSSEKA